MLAFVFPGQGSQYVGMGKDIIEHSRDLFEKASEILKFDLLKLCIEGPQSELDKTENTQPAILAVSYALLREVLATGIKPDYVAGHSLGEYTAALCAEVFSFEDALTITRKRGELMQNAQPEGKGAMAAVLGLDEDTIRTICKTISTGYVDIANLNCPGQIVIAGHTEAVSKASELATQKGAKKVIPLKVSIPSHCLLMKDASKKFEEFLKNFKFNDSSIPVISNVDASAKEKASEIIDALIKQLYSPVRWQDCVKHMSSRGVDIFVEIGPGKVLSGLIRRIEPSVKILNVEHINDAEKIREVLQ
ncbi:MAG TPA: ACP S-malonyltransferase [Thermodesulfovibrio thiophilus]|nr:ACP S-malonyltransferase [Thermodesulfovibrio thiophilus]HQD36870.1 ACP S-malonyltransferase [Thermodesulfovibrio thiophilus]